MLTRRSAIRRIATAAAGCIALPALAELFPQRGEGLRGRERGELGRMVAEFKRRFMVPAFSVAIARDSAFVYDEAFGASDREKAQLVDEYSVFRIASASKPITAVAIFTLIEKGKLNLNDKVFGASGVLGTKYGKQPYRQYVTDITVDHLLTHTCGGWAADANDPMYKHDSSDQAGLINWVLDTVSLTSPPGQQWAYSNFGYCLLGRVIEQASGQAYVDYVQSNILAPSGIQGMQIARNKEKQRFPHEVVYYGQYDEQPYKMNVTRMDADGGWVASSSNLVQFLDHIAPSKLGPGLLKPETIRTMTTPAPAYPQNSPARYARGWMVRGEDNGTWWHNGSFPGSTSIMVRAANGLRWAALANTRSQPHDDMDSALDRLMWDMVRSVPEWGA